MIVLRLRVDPFGFFADKEVSFLPGLNVVLGPNEAGKSTLFSAIKYSFIRAKLKKPDLAKYLGRFMPAGGGDTLRVELEFEASAGKCVLRRRWGPDPASELLIPGGGAIRDEDAVSAMLESILPAKQGTFWRVLMTGQAELVSTMEALKTSDDTLEDLADILRKAVQDMGDVSVDRFRRLLAEKDKAFNERWDAAARRPEGGHGIENPWKKGVGETLRAYYTKETVKAAFDGALRHERELDEVNAGLRGVSARLAAAEAFLGENQKALNDARERQTLEARLEATRAGMDSLRKAGAEWPAAEKRDADLKRDVTALSERRAPLLQEKMESEKEEAGRALRERHARIAQRKNALEEAGEKFRAAGPELSEKDLRKMGELSRALEKLEAGMEAGRLSVTLKAKEDLTLAVSEDFKPESVHKIGKGDSATFQAAARLRLSHHAMEMEVSSGLQGASDDVKKIPELRLSLKRLFDAYGVAGLAEAEERRRRFVQLLASEAAAKKSLEDELGGDSLKELEKRFASMGPSRQVRPMGMIEGDIARLEADVGAKERERADLAARVREWEKEYGSPAKLIDAIADARGREKELAVRTAELSPLPAGFSDAPAFIRGYEQKREEAKKASEERTALLQRKSALEASAPESSAEELCEQQKEAEARFQTAVRRGDAVRRVSALTEKLLAQGDAAVFSGIRAELEGMVARMTGNRYGKVEMDGSLPRALAAGKGGELGWERLSTGTKDVLALALRLAMASHFLGGAAGFLMMDDPLVDMDPERRKAAAEALKDFASRRQLLLFTCHPDHAELLGGNLIRL